MLQKMSAMGIILMNPSHLGFKHFSFICGYYAILEELWKSWPGQKLDNLDSLRVKATLTLHRAVHLHLYKINGRICLEEVHSWAVFENDKKVQIFAPFSTVKVTYIF
jgi:hypothetical protein